MLWRRIRRGATKAAPRLKGEAATAVWISGCRDLRVNRRSETLNHREMRKALPASQVRKDNQVRRGLLDRRVDLQ